jgi:hypothetical protein
LIGSFGSTKKMWHKEEWSIFVEFWRDKKWNTIFVWCEFLGILKEKNLLQGLKSYSRISI